MSKIADRHYDWRSTFISELSIGSRVWEDDGHTERSDAVEWADRTHGHWPLSDLDLHVRIYASQAR